MSSMYTSPDDARSDLFLSVGVFLFGPLVLGIVFQYLPLLSVPVLGPVLRIASELAVTALVPYLLMRYRRETFRHYGLQPARASTLAVGAVAILPLVAATVLVSLLVGDSPVASLPVANAGFGWLSVVVRTVRWLGTAFLAAYATVKARDAFRSDPRTIRDVSVEIGRILAIVLAVSALLLIVGGTVGVITALLLPIGALACVAVAVGSVRGPSSASRAVLLTPTVILALNVFNLTLDGRQFFVTLWLTAISACVGLVIGVYQEWRNSALAALGIGLVVALLTNV